MADHPPEYSRLTEEPSTKAGVQKLCCVTNCGYFRIVEGKIKVIELVLSLFGLVVTSFLMTKSPPPTYRFAFFLAVCIASFLLSLLYALLHLCNCYNRHIASVFRKFFWNLHLLTFSCTNVALFIFGISLLLTDKAMQSSLSGIVIVDAVCGLLLLVLVLVDTVVYFRRCRYYRSHIRRMRRERLVEV